MKMRNKIISMIVAIILLFSISYSYFYIETHRPPKPVINIYVNVTQPSFGVNSNVTIAMSLTYQGSNPNFTDIGSYQDGLGIAYVGSNTMQLDNNISLKNLKFPIRMTQNCENRAISNSDIHYSEAVPYMYIIPWELSVTPTGEINKITVTWHKNSTWPLTSGYYTVYTIAGYVPGHGWSQYYYWLNMPYFYVSIK